MTSSWNDLLGCLALESRGSGRPGPARFEGRSLQLDYHRLFGGQLLAQFVRAAEMACPGKDVKSMHVLFPRPGRSGEPVHYEAERHHEGRTFVGLTVVARQSHGTVATASVSLHAPEDGPVHQEAPAAPELPGPEWVRELGLLPWELRSVMDLGSPAKQPPRYDLWMRTPEISPALVRAMAAYATDLTLIGTGLLHIEGVSQHDAGKRFVSAVTTHSVWFHQPFRTDEWLVLHQHSPVFAHSRCFGRGDILTREGVLVASYAQEALVRLRDGE